MRTVTTTSDSSSRDGGAESDYPFPTGKEDDNADRLPNNPNYPWGGDGPVHRHRPVTDPKNKASDEAGPKHGTKHSRWDRVLTKLMVNLPKARVERDGTEDASDNV